MTSTYELVDFNLLDPSDPPYHCVGVAPSTRPQRRCHNPISKLNMGTAGVWIKKISNQKTTTLDELERLAGLCLCQRNHQDQAKTVARSWYNIIKQNIPAPPILPSQTITISATSACNSSQRTVQPVASSTSNDSLNHLHYLITDLQTARQTIASKDTRISTLLTELDTLRTAYQTFKDHNTNLVRGSLGQTSQLRDSRRTILHLEQEVADQNTRIRDLETEARNTGRKLGKSERDVEDLKYKKSLLEDNNTDLRASYVTLSQTSETNASRLKGQLRDCEAQKQESSTKISTLETDLEAATTKEQSLNDRTKQPETELEGAAEKAHLLDSKITSLTQSLNTAETQQRNSETEITNLHRQLNQATTSFQSLGSKLTDLETSLQQTETALNLSTTRLSTSEQALHQSVTRENLLTSRIEALGKELQDSRDEEDNKGARIEWLKGELDLVVRRAENLNKEIEEVKRGFERMLVEAGDRESVLRGKVLELGECLREERDGYFTGFCRSS